MTARRDTQIWVNRCTHCPSRAVESSVQESVFLPHKQTAGLSQFYDRLNMKSSCRSWPSRCLYSGQRVRRKQEYSVWAAADFCSQSARIKTKRSEFNMNLLISVWWRFNTSAAVKTPFTGCSWKKVITAAGQTFFCAAAAGRTRFGGVLRSLVSENPLIKPPPPHPPPPPPHVFTRRAPWRENPSLSLQLFPCWSIKNMLWWNN